MGDDSVAFVTGFVVEGGTEWWELGQILDRHRRADCGTGVCPIAGLADVRSWPPVWLVRGVILLPVVGPELQTEKNKGNSHLTEQVLAAGPVVTGVTFWRPGWLL